MPFSLISFHTVFSRLTFVVSWDLASLECSGRLGWPWIRGNPPASDWVFALQGRASTLCLLIFSDKVTLCILGWPGTCCVAQTLRAGVSYLWAYWFGDWELNCSSGRAASSFNCGAISLVPLLSVFFSLIISNNMQLCMYVPLFVSVLGCAGARGHQISLETEL